MNSAVLSRFRFVTEVGEHRIDRSGINDVAFSYGAFHRFIAIRSPEPLEFLVWIEHQGSIWKDACLSFACWMKANDEKSLFFQTEAKAS